MTSSIENLSVTDIQHLLKKQQNRVGVLQKRRARLVEDLENIDAEIAQLMGEGGIRYKNKFSLLKTACQVLAKKKSGLPLGELAEAILKTGYRTASGQFNNTVYQTIHKSDKIQRNDKTKKYLLKK